MRRPAGKDLTIEDLDFARMYRSHMARSGRPPKQASEWDARVKQRMLLAGASGYAQAFLARMDLGGARTFLLDVGCGPGTICLPLAGRLERVYGLDYSAAMLDALRGQAARQGADNAVTIRRAWEDHGSGVPVCDIAVASRASNVADLDAALDKLTAHARLRVYLTHLVGGHFMDPALADVLERSHQGFPDYIYVVNLLHRKGIHPRIDYIEVSSRLAGTASFEAFAARVSWTYPDLDAQALARLRAWYDADPGRAARGGAPMRWAFIHWEKTV